MAVFCNFERLKLQFIALARERLLALPLGELAAKLTERTFLLSPPPCGGTYPKGRGKLVRW